MKTVSNANERKRSNCYVCMVLWMDPAGKRENRKLMLSLSVCGICVCVCDGSQLGRTLHPMSGETWKRPANRTVLQ